ncbi:MAG: carbamoyltransferase C-terminal domain-containing protein [Candidatus Njordarchaeia archaeon]
MVYVLSIYDGHDSTACLLKDGRIIACAQEERFVRIKNVTAFPINAIEFLLNFAKISPQDLDLIVLPSHYGNFGWHTVYDTGIAGKVYKWFIDDRKAVSSYDVKIRPKSLYPRLGFKLGPYAGKKITKKRKEFVSKALKVDKDIIITTEHHYTHAVTALYASGAHRKFKEVLIFTADGEGDLVSSTVSIWENGDLRRIAQSHTKHSIGYFYTYITRFLGMKPLEHEYKVMGLAPYAPHYGLMRALEKIWDLYRVDGLEIKSKMISYDILGYLYKIYKEMRFDFIAAAAQTLLERTLLRWILNGVEKTGIRNILLSGGIFMNVKANMRIGKLKAVDSVFAMPSAGDTSLAIGAAYHGYKLLKPNGDPEPIRELYLGPNYSHEEIEHAIEQFKKANGDFQVKDLGKGIEDEVVNLVTSGKIVARFNGRMEWGARALGNRSIIADASDRGIIDYLNKAIKKRDFWMPFAPSIIGDYADEYILSPNWRKVDPEYMIFAFESTKRAQSDLAAAMHPFDKTLRPQLVWRDWNESYYRILEGYMEETGRVGFLNTSFNIHGEPIVCSPWDAIDTFGRSGLKYLALGDYLLVKKK